MGKKKKKTMLLSYNQVKIKLWNHVHIALQNGNKDMCAIKKRMKETQ